MPDQKFKAGDWVVYQSHPGAPREDGEVVSFSHNGVYVFVWFTGDLHPKAVRPQDLKRGYPRA